MPHLRPPVDPMLAKAVATIPAEMVYEPKWDGFRCLVFREGDDVVLHSRGGKDLARYFPELITAILENTPPECVLDGEIVIIDEDRLNFSQLTERIHPAASRIGRLADEIPAAFIAWDVLALDSTILLDTPFEQRRQLLERALGHAEAPIYLSPQTRDLDEAQRWFHVFEGAGLDGIIAKDPGSLYLPGKRAMAKIKHSRDCDAVVAGYKLHASSTAQQPLIGSLQLGVYTQAGELAWIGAVSAFAMPIRAELAAQFVPQRLSPATPAFDAHPWSPARPQLARRPGAVSRWSTAGNPVELLPPELVVEVAYDQLDGDRFRHMAHLRRWRPDRDPASCRLDQLETPVRFDLAHILGP